MPRTHEIDVLPIPLTEDGPAVAWHYRDGTLAAEAPARSDLFVDPATDGDRPDAPRLLGAVSGDFQLSATVTVGFGSAFDAGVLTVYVDETNWVKLCFEFTPQGRPSVVTVVTNGVSDDANAFELDENTVRLRLSRVGRTFACHASTDGTWWRLVRYFTLVALPADAPARVGFLVQSPTGSGCPVSFSDLAFVPSPPSDLRDGS
jgi:regulation of enolase protein 1 (concanavalin A-like superfamily)